VGSSGEPLDPTRAKVPPVRSWQVGVACGKVRRWPGVAEASVSRTVGRPPDNVLEAVRPPDSTEGAAA